LSTPSFASVSLSAVAAVVDDGEEVLPMSGPKKPVGVKTAPTVFIKKKMLKY
jgi:hypothetical protein